MNNFIKKVFVRGGQEIKKELLYLSSGSRPKKILFDHLPKCGGSTLREYLRKHYPQRKTFFTNGLDPYSSVEKFKQLSQHQRYGYDLILGHLTNELIAYADPECLKVTVLREPVERIISHYYYAKRSPEHYLYSKITERDISLEEYATSELSDELRNWYTSHFSGLAVADVDGSPEAALSRAVEVLFKQYDVVGILSDFPSFIDMLRVKVGLRYPYDDKKVNVTSRRPKFDDISPSIIEKIREVNYLDVTLYECIKSPAG